MQTSSTTRCRPLCMTYVLFSVHTHTCVREHSPTPPQTRRGRLRIDSSPLLAVRGVCSCASVRGRSTGVCMRLPVYARATLFCALPAHVVLARVECAHAATLICSCGLWPAGTTTLEESEVAGLSLLCDRAQITNTPYVLFQPRAQPRAACVCAFHDTCDALACTTSACMQDAHLGHGLRVGLRDPVHCNALPQCAHHCHVQLAHPKGVH